ncbi:uncharacterized protein GLRG_09994 [Colletotrichum graminicola M1.001]|uniref:Uncharacterized protein n=1 Tax=Colletotrichum graminicola (strain M1.001 / M2 / FGSC 10212) TaxID=645133 RepID=E3QVG2_COLGM|nr:uncharacterized protein GLRG_09994 [Colletotrichum graminicola M1.001]EFQ34850.1 hypothetical protein GLRG_09994 [Colletotrichum graminicola M1.001]
MKLSNGIPMCSRDARLLYLSCLTCTVLLLGALGYSVWLHSDVYTSSLFGSAVDTLTNPNGPSNGASSSMQNEPDLSGFKYSFILPTYTADIPLAIEFLQSFMCLCTDYREINIHVIVSDSSEHELFRSALDDLAPCGERFGIFPVPPGNVGGSRPNVEIVNLFDILPPVFHTLTGGNITADDTSALLRERGKFQYQTIKKLAAAAALDYDWALWVDSESIVVQPFSARRSFGAYARAPTVWRSRLANRDSMRAIMRGAADVLRLPEDTFGPDFWNLESQQWMVERAVLDDLVRHVEAAHGRDFWAVWAAHGGPFEVNLYNLHVHSRKLETTDPMFGKYRILETETEMEKYGVCKCSFFFLLFFFSLSPLFCVHVDPQTVGYPTVFC